MFRSINSFLNMIFKSSGKSNTQTAFRRYEKDFTPTYILIAKDLENKESQIFEAAVYYLCTLAVLKKEYQKDILDILNKAALSNKKYPERSIYIQKMLQEKKLV